MGPLRNGGVDGSKHAPDGPFTPYNDPNIPLASGDRRFSTPEAFTSPYLSEQQHYVKAYNRATLDPPLNHFFLGTSSSEPKIAAKESSMWIRLNHICPEDFRINPPNVKSIGYQVMLPMAKAWYRLAQGTTLSKAAAIINLVYQLQAEEQFARHGSRSAAAGVPDGVEAESLRDLGNNDITSDFLYAEFAHQPAGSTDSGEDNDSEEEDEDAWAARLKQAASERHAAFLTGGAPDFDKKRRAYRDTSSDTDWDSDFDDMRPPERQDLITRLTAENLILNKRLRKYRRKRMQSKKHRSIIGGILYSFSSTLESSSSSSSAADDDDDDEGNKSGEDVSSSSTDPMRKRECRLCEHSVLAEYRTAELQNLEYHTLLLLAGRRMVKDLDKGDPTLDQTCVTYARFKKLLAEPHRIKSSLTALNPLKDKPAAAAPTEHDDNNNSTVNLLRAIRAAVDEKGPAAYSEELVKAVYALVRSEENTLAFWLELWSRYSEIDRRYRRYLAAQQSRLQRPSTLNVCTLLGALVREEGPNLPASALKLLQATYDLSLAEQDSYKKLLHDQVTLEYLYYGRDRDLTQVDNQDVQFEFFTGEAAMY
ncbi:protein ORF45 [Cyprinid herpesvirus 1]|uniref:Protein ORF45 n=1 Tax=Cyprinid herpesvirus 1 TaxID=317858 RepID=K7PCK1_9VIRU|nr:protein ORF45 [Cyprinid herpesvirus 1]AFJ20345.1 protein ORF45 [Cyprinid herpesvirus 1]